MEPLKQAQTNVSDRLNYGGIAVDPDTNRLVLDHDREDLMQEIADIRALASELNGLADALNERGVLAADRLPTEADGDEMGYIQWLIEGRWRRCYYEAPQPEGAFRWRRMPSSTNYGHPA